MDVDMCNSIGAHEDHVNRIMIDSSGVHTWLCRTRSLTYRAAVIVAKIGSICLLNE